MIVMMDIVVMESIGSSVNRVLLEKMEYANPVRRPNMVRNL